MRGWSEILREAGAPEPAGGGPRAREEFWRDFKARARQRPQAAAPSPTAVALRWAAAAGAPLAAAASLALALRLWSGAPAAAAVGIESLEVVAAHRAVWVLSDASSGSTIVWVDWNEPPAAGAAR